MERARVVVIGGGVAGCSVAYHLAAAGWDDVLLLEKGELTSGSTMHAAGLVTMFNPSPTMMRFRRYSIELFGRLGVFETVGSLRIASSERQLQELERGVSRVRGIGLDAVLLSPEETLERIPAASGDNLFGSVWVSGDGHLDPHTVTHALADAARALGARVRTGVRVTGIQLSADRAVRSVDTTGGRVETEVVVNAAGLWGPRVSAMVGARTPATPVDHQHAAIAARPGYELPHAMPCFRDPDNLIYGRSEAGGIVFGGYEADPNVRWIDGAPWEHGGSSLPPAQERFEPLLRGAIRRFPFLEGAGLVKLVCHPDAMSPDANPLLGPVPGVRGYWIAAGLSLNGFGAAGGIGKSIAEWITAGDTEWDLTSYRPWRFGSAYDDLGWIAELARETYRYYYLQRYPFDHDELGRPKRVSALHSRLQEAGCVFQVKNGWERPDHFVAQEPSRRAGADQRVYGFEEPPWFSRVGEEHSAVRERAGLFDLSSFGKIEVEGPGALSLLERVSANRVDRPVGRIVYAQFLDPSGGIVGDITITRLADERFRVVTGAAAVDSDLGWLRLNRRPEEPPVTIRDVTERLAVIGLWGRSAPDVFVALGVAGPDRFRAATVSIGPADVWAQGLTYVGEAGWELWIDPEWATQIWDVLLEAGHDLGIEPCGYRVLDGLRLEAGYRALGTDLTAADDPDEAGLYGCVVTEGRDFVGRDALIHKVPSGTWLCTLGLGEGGYVTVYGGEPVVDRDRIVGRVRSSAYGYTARRHLVTAYLPSSFEEGHTLEVEVFGERIPAEVLVDGAGEPLIGRIGTR